MEICVYVTCIFQLGMRARVCRNNLYCIPCCHYLFILEVTAMPATMQVPAASVNGEDKNASQGWPRLGVQSLPGLLLLANTLALMTLFPMSVSSFARVRVQLLLIRQLVRRSRATSLLYIHVPQTPCSLCAREQFCTKPARQRELHGPRNATNNTHPHPHT